MNAIEGRNGSILSQNDSILSSSFGANSVRGEFDIPIEEELEFADDDESLPWLESDYDEGEESGYDTGRIVGFALLLLLALASVLGAMWWVANRGSSGGVVADGSTISAPEGPYKERPEDAGGKTFAGTGNIAPSVGEGETREGRLAADGTDKGNASASTGYGAGNGAGGTVGSSESSAAPKPSIDIAGSGPGAAPAASQPPAQASSPPPASAASPSLASGSKSGGVSVQVGAFASRARAEKAWGILGGQTDVLSGVKHRVVQATVDGGTVYRLQALPGNSTAARTLCTKLKADGLACQVKR